jgi:hypothetical protein
MQLVLEQQLPCAAEVAWVYLTSPRHMAHWSLAAVRPLAVGDGGGMDGVGALREITLESLGRKLAFKEVIEHSEPAVHLVYRAFAGLPVRHHRGEITLRPRQGGTHLRWAVSAEFLIPGSRWVARPILELQLRESLRRLAQCVRSEPALPLATPKPLDERQELPALYPLAEQCHAEQREMADALEAREDPKYLFTRVYQYVTEAQLAACRTGRARHPAWVLRLIPHFHAYYTDNLRSWRGPHPELTEVHWAEAFQSMEVARKKLTPNALTMGLLRGVAAHVEEDLPRALAVVYLKHYARRCDYVRFRADFLLMAGIFHQSADRLLAALPPSALPRAAHVLRAVAPVELQDLFLARYYDLARRRREAFERGARLAVMLGSRQQTVAG